MMGPPICPANASVFRHVLEKSPFAKYIHCSGHCLNLVIAHFVHGLRYVMYKY